MSRYHPGAFIKFPPDTVYFITITVIDWVDVFTREEYKRIIADSLDFCRKTKGLRIYAWVLMTNHIHLITSHDVDNEHLAAVIGDFKKFTSKSIVKAIRHNPVESRQKWLLEHFNEESIKANTDAVCSVSKSAERSEKNHFHLWQRGYDSYCIYNIIHLRQKIDYLHDNPVRAGIVSNPYDYLYSSAPNYADRPSVIEIDYLDLGLTAPY